MSAEVHDLVSRATQQLSNLSFQDEPPWSAAIPTSIMASSPWPAATRYEPACNILDGKAIVLHYLAPGADAPKVSTPMTAICGPTTISSRGHASLDDQHGHPWGTTVPRYSSDCIEKMFVLAYSPLSR